MGGGDRARFEKVLLPVMPKGVEHREGGRLRLREQVGAPPGDAERR